MGELVFATGPVHLDEDGDDLRADLGRALGALVGRTVVVRAERSYPSLAAEVAERRCALAWLPPALCVRADDAGALAALTRAERSAGGLYQGALFVPEGSRIRAAEDLRGTKVAWVDRTSCAGYLFPRLAIARAGLDPASTFTSESFLESHGRVVRAVRDGAVDVGATYVELADPGRPEAGLALAGWNAYVPARSMRAVLVSASIPSDAVCVIRGGDAALEEALRDALLALGTQPSGSALLRTMLNADRLVAASREDYAPVREALGEG